MSEDKTLAGQSILRTIRQMIGPDSDYDVFDTDLITHINSVFMMLSQAGVGPSIIHPFMIESEAETWGDFSDYLPLLQAVKSFIYLEVKNLFDPPASSSVQKAYEEKALEYLWRLNVQAETLALEE